jgi:hypothetical protein
MSRSWREKVFLKNFGNNQRVEPGKVYDLHEAAERIPWITARQYPPPHQYAILERTPHPHWHVLNCAIQKHPDSYLAYFRGYQRPMRYQCRCAGEPG